MATTIPPVHNYESQIVFSNQSNNIKSTDVINWIQVSNDVQAQDHRIGK